MRTTLTPHTRACVDKALVASLGKPWAPLGRGPDNFDCWGFVQYVYRQAGIEIPDAILEPVPCVATAAKAHGVRISPAPARTPYALVMFGKDGVFGHTGIYHPSGLVYHCLERHGVVGHNLPLLSGVFNTLSYWSVLDAVFDLSPEST
jgi:cell wall-associated NlpC family hydrolase